MNKTQKENVKNTFDAAAEQFDEIGTPFFKLYGQIMADLMTVSGDEVILDIACGKGATTFPLIKRQNGNGKIIAIDISEKMIEACKKKINGQKHTIDFLVMDAEQLDLEDESVDHAICSFGLFFLSDITKGMNEILRVLKPGGTFLFSSWNKDYHLKWLFGLLAKYIPALQEQKPYFNDKINDIDFASLEGLEKILSMSKLDKKQIRIENIDCYYNNAEEWIESRWTTAFRMHFERLSETDYQNFKKEIIENLENYKENGKIKITMSAFITEAVKRAN